MRGLWTAIKILILLLFATVTATLVYMYVKDPVLTTRLVQIPVSGVTGPREAVRGEPGEELPAASEPVVSDAAKSQAIEYGQETGSHALLIYRGDGIELEQYYAGYNADTRSQTQSMHKSVLALLVGIAIDEGFIASVDEPAATYLPEWRDDARSKITIRHMLRQTSGIDFATVGLNPLGGFYQLMLGADVTAAALNLPAAVEPGAQFDYNSAIPQNVGLIIERATGKRYAEYLTDALWRRLGAADAYVLLDSEMNRMARTSCCLDATARSWLRIGLLHLNAGRVGDMQVVPEQWMQDVVTPGALNPNYGYFTWLGTEHNEFRYYNRKTNVRVFHSEPFVAKDVIFFDGFGGQRVYVVPSHSLVIVRIGDSTQSWDDSYLPNLIVRDLEKNAPSDQT